MTEIEKLQFPTGKFEKDPDITPEKRQQWIDEIAATPANVRAAVAGLSDEQLDTPYRPDGWTIRQVVHHLPDSHINSYMRFKLALTEENPTIRPYWEDRWAELSDGKSAPVEYSLAFLDALHARWVLTLQNMSEDDFKRTFFHPESKETVDLDTNLQIYAWHCRHHLAHITSLKERMGW